MRPGEVGLSLLNPEQYRYELLGKIADDVKQAAKIFANNYSVSGIDTKMLIRRISVTEVELYLHYRVIILPQGMGFLGAQ